MTSEDLVFELPKGMIYTKRKLISIVTQFSSTLDLGRWSIMIIFEGRKQLSPKSRVSPKSLNQYEVTANLDSLSQRLS